MPALTRAIWRGSALRRKELQCPSLWDDLRRDILGRSKAIDMDQSVAVGCFKPVLGGFCIYCVLSAACYALRGKVGCMPAADLKAIAEFFDLFGCLF